MDGASEPQIRQRWGMFNCARLHDWLLISIIDLLDLV